MKDKPEKWPNGILSRSQGMIRIMLFFENTSKQNIGDRIFPLVQTKGTPVYSDRVIYKARYFPLELICTPSPNSHA